MYIDFSVALACMHALVGAAWQRYNTFHFIIFYILKQHVNSTSHPKDFIFI